MGEALTSTDGGRGKLPGEGGEETLTSPAARVVLEENSRPHLQYRRLRRGFNPPKRGRTFPIARDPTGGVVPGTIAQRAVGFAFGSLRTLVWRCGSFWGVRLRD